MNISRLLAGVLVSSCTIPTGRAEPTRSEIQQAVVGFGVTRHGSRGNPTAVLLPAADVLEIAEQAKTAKPLPKESTKATKKEAPKAEKSDKSE